MTSHDSRHDDIDPFFVFDFEALDDPDSRTQRWSTWLSVEPMCRGPEPRPDWLVTSQGALDTELGVLKTGKEADVFLLERHLPGADGVLVAAKRYRSLEHRLFHRSGVYTEGRKTRDSRDARALAGGTAHGRAVAAGQWAWSEWEALTRLWEIGVPVPYPVQVDGTEILMEWITQDDATAPRLAEVRPGPDLLRHLFEQIREAMATMAQHGLAHGDLSAYNILVAGERPVIIDMPQVVDLVANPQGLDFLMRDCANVCAWFRRRGLAAEVADEHVLFDELMAQAFS